MDTVIEILISWFPMILLIAVWVYFMKKGGLGRQHTYMEQVLVEQKVMNEHLEKIANSLQTLANK